MPEIAAPILVDAAGAGADPSEPVSAPAGAALSSTRHLASSTSISSRASPASYPGSGARRAARLGAVEALIAILAGGRATRLGGRKATAELAGRPLISYPLAAALGSGQDAIVVAKPRTELPELSVPTLREPAEPVHPLCGLVSALRQGEGRPVIALACDLPLVTPELLDWVASQRDPLVVPRIEGRLQPLLARYEASLLRDLEADLHAQRPLQETVARLHPRMIDEEEIARFGRPDRLLLNVNSEADLQRAGRLLRGTLPAPGRPRPRQRGLG